jgi:hypothetical protein
MLYPTVLRCSTVFQPIITVYAYIVKVSHNHVLLVRICNNLMHMWHHVTNHLIISNDKDSNSENRIKLRVRDRSAEARHFLAASHNFASAQGTSLNVLDATTGMWTSVPGRWIQAALNLMEADARTWALPYLEEIQAGNMPFGGVWQTFLDHFTRRFAPLNTEDSARDALKRT